MGGSGPRKGSSRRGLGLTSRSSTKSASRIKRLEREEIRAWLPVYEEYAADRPKVRGDCENAQRPCVFVSCKYNTYIDVKKSGSLVLNFPDKNPEEVPPQHSCALDIADLGGSSLEDVARVLNMTRERVRQIQEVALHKLGLNPGQLDEFAEVRNFQRTRILTHSSNLRPSSDSDEEESEVEEDEEESFFGSALNFLSEHPEADRLISNRIWRIYKRKTTLP